MLILLAFLAGVALALLAVAWWLSAVFAALDLDGADEPREPRCVREAESIVERYRA